jgi:hypothetical protein
MPECLLTVNNEPIQSEKLITMLIDKFHINSVYFSRTKNIYLLLMPKSNKKVFMQNVILRSKNLKRKRIKLRAEL